jgi:transposase
MGNVLDTRTQQQVIALGRLGWTLRRIERETGVRRETVSDYLKAAGLPVRGRGRPGEGKEKPAISGEVSTDSPPTPWPPPPTRAPQASACEPYRDRIEAALKLGRNAMAIWQDLVDVGFTARYASVRRFVRHARGSMPAEARVVIIAKPGEECQVDYGDGPMVRHPETGKYRRTRLFVLTLACSRKAVRLLVWRSSAQTWAELHERAFRRLGGSTRVVVLDNLKEGVLTPDVYEPTLNPLYRDVLAHYGVVGLPCRVGDPDRKGKVESGIGHTQKTPLQGQRFETLDQAQTYLDRWEAHWADTRIHGTTKRQVAEMFATADAAGPAGRAVSVLPLRRAHGASRWVRRSRGGLLLDAARVDRSACGRAVDRPPRPAARSKDRPTPARARPRAPRLASHRRRRPAGADARVHPEPARARPARGRASPRRLYLHPRA